MKKGRIPDIVICITARVGSERQRFKAISDIGGQPLIHHIAKRLDEAGKVIIATSTRPENDILEEWAKGENRPVYRHPVEEDVVGRVVAAVDEFYPNAQLIMRGLCDCPFHHPPFIKRAGECIWQNDADAFYWALPPDTWPIYGTREFPLSRHAWDIINQNAHKEERMHTDMYYHRHRDKFNIVYHESPPSLYFREHYRVEVDYPEDLELLRGLYSHFGYYPTLDEAIRFLDTDNRLWRINRFREEKTGMIVSFRHDERIKWWREMIGHPIVMWDDSVWQMPESGKPIFCRAKKCLLGYAVDGKLYQNGAVIEGSALLHCPCGAGYKWSHS